MSYKIGDMVLVRWLGKTKGYVQGTTWYNATITAERGDETYDIDYEDDIRTVELKVPEIRLVRNVLGDDEHIHQQIRARNEEQLSRQRPKGASRRETKAVFYERLMAGKRKKRELRERRNSRLRKGKFAKDVK